MTRDLELPGPEDNRGWRRLVVPRDATSAPFTAAQLYAALHAGSRGRAVTQLLLTGTGDDVGIFLRAKAHRVEPLAAMVLATYPDAELVPEAPDLEPAVASSSAVVGARWRLAADPAHPVKTVQAFAPSEPMAMTLGALAEARPGELGALSLVLTPAPAGFGPRAVRRARAVADGADLGPAWQRALTVPFDVLEAVLSSLVAPSPGPAAARPGTAAAGRPGATPRPADATRLAAAILDKAAQPAFRVTLRTAWCAPTGTRAAAGHDGLVSALGQFAVIGQNAFVPRALSARRCRQDLLDGRLARRERVVLGVHELAGLVHCPGPDLVVPRLRRTGARRRAPSVSPAAQALPLADVAHRGAGPAVGVSVEQLLGHAYVVGPSGTGKTTLLAGLVLGLVERGTAGVVLDPHGDLARQVLLRLPAGASDRVLLFDLADPARLPALNPLWVAPGPVELTAVARANRSAAVTAVFADIWDLHRATSPNLLHFLEAALAALIATGEHCLADLPRFLTDGAFRNGVVRAGSDPRIAARWREFAAFNADERTRTVRSILNKAADFDRNPLLGAVFGAPGPGLRLDEVMDRGQLLVVSLPRGLVPEGTVELVGSLLVSLLHQAALAREARPPADRPPVVAVIDEFQEFALSTFAKVVTSARKYGLGLVVANQNLSRIRAVSPAGSGDVLATLLANVSTLVTFRTAPGDADVLAPFVPPFLPADLTALAPYESYWRLPGPAGPHVVSARTRPLPAPLRSEADLAGLAAAIRVPGGPLRHRPAPDEGWTE